MDKVGMKYLLLTRIEKDGIKNSVKFIYPEKAT